MLEGAQVIREDLEDATIAYNHYRENTGKDLYIDYEKVHREDKIIQSYVDGKIKIAQMDAEKILTQIEEKRLYSTTDTVSFSMIGKKGHPHSIWNFRELAEDCWCSLYMGKCRCNCTEQYINTGYHNSCNR